MENIKVGKSPVPESSQVVPVFKKGSRDNLGNYRPVIVSPITCLCVSNREVIGESSSG